MQVSLFSGCERGFVTALCLRMNMTTMHPNNIVFRAGDAGSELYIIRKVPYDTVAQSARCSIIVVPSRCNLPFEPHSMELHTTGLICLY